MIVEGVEEEVVISVIVVVLEVRNHVIHAIFHDGDLEIHPSLGRDHSDLIQELVVMMPIRQDRDCVHATFLL